jgi:hypothetical protein
MLAVITVVSVILAMGGLVGPVPAFLGAIVASLVLAIVGAVVGGGAGLRASPLTLRGVVGIVLWVLAVGTVVYLASIWSDFATP